jgi:hypothetical protein
MSMQPGAVKALEIWAVTSPCAHICRFCQIGDRAGRTLPFERWHGVVQRFQDWKRERNIDIDIDQGWPGPSWDFDLETLARVEAATGYPFTVLPLGGVKMRPPAQMRQWLKDRIPLGLERVHAALVGIDDLHDRWVGRRGDFQFLLQTFRTALELELKYSVTLYLIKSSLPMLEQLREMLDALPVPPEYKHVRQFYYSGYAAHHEDERITQSDLDSLPAWAAASFQEHFQPRTEGYWIEQFASRGSDPFNMYLNIELTAQNIAALEKRSCDEILAEVEARAKASVERIPAWPELAARYGDAKNQRLYSENDVIWIWIDRFLQEHPFELDASLHGGLSSSKRPPALWSPSQPSILKEALPILGARV